MERAQTGRCIDEASTLTPGAATLTPRYHWLVERLQGHILPSSPGKVGLGVVVLTDCAVRTAVTSK